MPPKPSDLARKAGAEPDQPDDVAVDEGRRPSKEDAAVLQERTVNATKEPLKADQLISDETMKSLNLTPEQLADTAYYIVTEAFTLTWANHHKIEFKQGGPYKLPKVIAEHWYADPGNKVRVKLA
jgi:hypothetical protein